MEEAGDDFCLCIPSLTHTKVTNQKLYPYHYPLSIPNIHHYPYHYPISIFHNNHTSLSFCLTHTKVTSHSALSVHNYPYHHPLSIIYTNHQTSLSFHLSPTSFSLPSFIIHYPYQPYIIIIPSHPHKGNQPCCGIQCTLTFFKLLFSAVQLLHLLQIAIFSCMITSPFTNCYFQLPDLI